MASHNAQSTTGKPSKSAARPHGNAKTSAARAKAQAKIDDAAEQTFPASDAPGGWAGRDIAPQDREDAQKEQSEKGRAASVNEFVERGSEP